MPTLNPTPLSAIDDGLVDIADDLRVLALAFDSRSLDIDRVYASAAIALLQRKIDLITDIRNRLTPNSSEDVQIQNGGASSDDTDQ